jgi:hypothetical protein
MYGIIWEKIFEFCSKLRSKRFIVRDNEGRLLEVLDYIRYRKGFSSSCSSEEGSLIFSTFKKLFDLLNRLWLVSSWLIG